MLRRPLCRIRPHLYLPSIDIAAGAADYHTAYTRLLSLEYLFYVAACMYVLSYGFMTIKHFCDAHSRTYRYHIRSPSRLLAEIGSAAYDDGIDNQWADFVARYRTRLAFSLVLMLGSEVLRHVATAATATGVEDAAADPHAVASRDGEDAARDIATSRHSPCLLRAGSWEFTRPLAMSTTMRPTGIPARLLSCFYFAVGVIFVAVVHGPHFFMPLLLTLANYLVFTRLQRWCPYWLFMTIMWAAHISLLYIIECQKGFEETYWLQYYFPTRNQIHEGVPGYARKPLWRQRMRWYVAFRMTTLRLIAFNYDLWEATHCAARARERAADKHDTTCIECAQLREQNSSSSGGTALPAEASRCYKYRTECPRDLGDYNFLNYLAYVVFPPLYLAGPMSSFNAFVSYMRVPSTAMPARKMAVYALRIINIYLNEYVLLHFIHVAEISKHTALILKMDLAEQAHFLFYSLTYIWLKFNFIWKSSRLFAMFSGIEVPEDMRRCLCNTFSVRDFWRDWHASFNLWIVRYMYVPMGGRSRVALSILPIFLFIALWHDPALHLLKWALCIAAMFVVELVVSACFGWVAGLFHREVAAASSTGGDAAGSNVGDEEAGARPSQRSQRGGRVAATVALLLRPAARLTARHMGPRARAWCYRMLRVLGGMSTIFGLIVANLIGFSMQNSEATFRKVGPTSLDTEADRVISNGLKKLSLRFGLVLVVFLYCGSSTALIDRDLAVHQVRWLKSKYGLEGV
ncbi:glycerol uptake protein [Lotmaria passim]